MVFRSVSKRRVKQTCREETSGSVMDHSKLMMLRHTYTGDDSSAVATVVAELTHRHFTAVLEIRAFLRKILALLFEIRAFVWRTRALLREIWAFVCLIQALLWKIRAGVWRIRAAFVENPGACAENPGVSVENPGACAENPGVSAENPSRLVGNPGRLCGKSEVCGVETQGALVEILGGCVGFIRAGAGYPGGAVRHLSALGVSGVESKYSAH